MKPAKFFSRIKANVAVTWIICFVLTLFSVSLVKRREGDDLNFEKWLQDTRGIEWVWDRYFQWSGRIFSESLAAISIPLPQFLWAVTDALAIILLAYSLIRILGQPVTSPTVIVAWLSIWLISPGVLTDTIYWVAGSFAYVWPISMAFFSGILLRNLYYREHTRYAFLYVIAGFLGSLGVEQIAPCLIAFSLLVLLSRLRRKDGVPASLISYFALVIFGFLLELFAPGSKVRSAVETDFWYPQFPELSLFQKIKSGIKWQFNITANQLLIIITLIVIGAVAILLQKSSKQLVRLRLFAMVLCGSLVTLLFSDYLQIKENFFSFNAGEGITEVNIVFTYLFWLFFLVGSSLFVIWMSSQRLIDTFVLLAAVASGALMYFSPTIYGSGARTVFVSSVLLLIPLLRFAYKDKTGIMYWLIAVPAITSMLHISYDLLTGL